MPVKIENVYAVRKTPNVTCEKCEELQAKLNTLEDRYNLLKTSEQQAIMYMSKFEAELTVYKKENEELRGECERLKRIEKLGAMLLQPTDNGRGTELVGHSTFTNALRKACLFEGHLPPDYEHTAEIDSLRKKLEIAAEALEVCDADVSLEALARIKEGE